MKRRSNPGIWLMLAAGAVYFVIWLSQGQNPAYLSLGAAWLCPAIAVYEDERKRQKKKEEEDKQ